jgi:hypothetical protein
MKILLIAICGLVAMPVGAEPIPMTPDRWEIEGQGGFETADGRQILRLGSEPGQPRKGGQANIKQLEFATGVIEFDIRLPDDREFSGPIFRQAEGGQAEIVYFRPHLNGKPDAIQYTPVVNGSLAWQIFTGQGFEAEATYPIDRWFRVRADIYISSATVSVDGKPVLRIHDLKNGLKPGSLGFAALMGGTRLANLNVQTIADYRDPEQIPPRQPLAAGTVLAWQVSEALTQSEGQARAARSDWRGLKWHPIAVEDNGIANLSKAGPDEGDRHSYIARFNLRSDVAKRVPMEFCFSDKVRIYLNGDPIYEGADLQASRDYRFLGHVGFWDTAFLPLKAGTNQIAFVVTDDTNGGTAAAARFRPELGGAIEQAK